MNCDAQTTSVEATQKGDSKEQVKDFAAKEEEFEDAHWSGEGPSSTGAVVSEQVCEEDKTAVDVRFQCEAEVLSTVEVCEETEVIRRKSVPWYLRCCFCFHRPWMHLTPSEPRALREANTSKYCWPHNKGRKLYLNHYSTVKAYDFYPVRSDKAKKRFWGYLKKPNTKLYIMAGKKNRLRLSTMDGKPPHGDFIFEIDPDSRTDAGWFFVKHKNLFFGTNDSNHRKAKASTDRRDSTITVILVDDIGRALDFTDTKPVDDPCTYPEGQDKK